MRGYAELKTPGDLARKVQRDLKRVRADHSNVDAAFDFFITAFSLIDWVHPGNDAAAAKQRKALRNAHPLLRIAGHLCNGAKHFEAKDWGQVESLGPRNIRMSAFGHWTLEMVQRFPADFFGDPRLTIRLTAAEAKRFGVSELDVLDTAETICAFWEQRLNLPPLP
jgi:hypothetical protein